jgi:GDPmannose 4,6-dehydratase
MQRVLVLGCNGQDGRLLATSLRRKGYLPFGVARSDREQVAHEDKYEEIFLSDFTKHELAESLIADLEPTIIFHLAAINKSSNEQNRYENKKEEICARAVQVGITENVISTIERKHLKTRLVLAGSSRMYNAGGVTKSISRFSVPAPVDSYGIYKVEAKALLEKARDRGVNAGTAILFNHESRLRKQGFLFPHLADEISEVLKGNRSEIRVKDANSMTDWHAAQDTIEGLIKMAEQPSIEDYVFASGNALSVRELVSEYFRDLQNSTAPKVVSTSPRHSIGVLIGDIRDTQKSLGWTPKIPLVSILDELVAQRLGQK